jgi:glycosyltransferase involved in cell wall biosynthesis
MNVSVIIPTLNEEAYIGALLESLKLQTYKSFEVLVVDCGSTDNTRTIVKRFKFTTLLKEKGPVGNQRNKGGVKAKGDILFFLDADVVCNKQFIEKCVERMTKRKIDIAVPFYIPTPGGFIINVFYGFFNVLFFIFQKYSPSGAGSCIIVRKSVFTNAGGFKQYYQFDDIEFIRRASLFGTFSVLPVSINVSDRRFREENNAMLIAKYFILGVLFFFNAFGAANYVSYAFGRHKKFI